MAGFQLHLLNPLVGYGVAQRVNANSLVVRVRGGGEQIHGLHHVGVPADDHVHPQVAQLLGDGPLGLILRCLIFRAPVDVEEGGLRTLGHHVGTDLGHFRIKPRQVVGGEIVHQSRLLHLLVVVQPGFAGIHHHGVGVAGNAQFDPVDIHNGVAGFLLAEPGAHRFQPLGPDLLHGALQTDHQGIIAVVVGGEQQIKSGILHAVQNGVRAVETGVSLVGKVRAAQSGFQIGHGIVGLGDVGLDIGKQGIKVVLPFSLVTQGVVLLGKDGGVHQQVAHGRNGGGTGDHRSG